jgi:hypothetical protein
VDVLKAPPASKPNVLDDKSLRRLAYLSHAVCLHRTGERQALSPVKRTPGDAANAAGLRCKTGRSLP